MEQEVAIQVRLCATPGLGLAGCFALARGHREPCAYEHLRRLNHQHQLRWEVLQEACLAELKSCLAVQLRRGRGRVCWERVSSPARVSFPSRASR